MKNDREIYELLNDIEINEEDFIEVEVSELEKTKVKKNLKKSMKKKNYKKYAIVAGIALSIGMGAITVEPALAYNIPILGDLLLDKEIENNIYKDYAEIIGETKEHRGVKVTLNSAVIDENRLAISYSFSDEKGRLTEEKIGEIMHLERSGISINGESSFTGSGDWERVDDNNLNIIYFFDISDRKIPNEVEIDIVNKEILGVKGDFGFKFRLNKEKINGESIVLDNLTEKNEYLEKINKNNKYIDIKKISKTPLGMTILGISKDINDLKVLDSQGDEILGGFTGFDGSTDLSEYSFDINEYMEEITLIPIKDKEKNNLKSETIPLEKNMEGKEILIDKNTKMIIEDVYVDKDYIIINYNSEIRGNLNLKNPIGLFLKNGEEIIDVIGEGLTEKQLEKIWEKYDKYGTKSSQGIFKIKNKEDINNIEIGAYYWDNKEALIEDSIKIRLKDKE